MFCPKKKRVKTDLENDVIEMQCAFIRASYSEDADLPKTKLIAWCHKNKHKSPRYESIHEDKLFRSIVIVAGKKYSSTFW